MHQVIHINRPIITSPAVSISGLRDVIVDERRSGNKDGSSLSLGGHSIAASVDSQITSGGNLGIMVDIQ